MTTNGQNRYPVYDQYGWKTILFGEHPPGPGFIPLPLNDGHDLFIWQFPCPLGWMTFIRYLIFSRSGMVRIVKEIIKVIPEPLKSHETSRNRSEGEHYNRRKYFTLAKTVVKKNNYNLRSLYELILPSLKSNSLCLPPIISCNSHTSVWKCSQNYQAKEGKSAFSLTAWKLGRGRTKCFARWVL